MGNGIFKNFGKSIVKTLTKGRREKYIMDVKERAKDIGEVTLFTSDCMGGLIYHSLGKRFLSPTINMSIEDGMFLKFCANYDKYFNEDITVIESENSYPVGILGKGSALGGVRIAFEHYIDGAEAIEKWNIRKSRVIPGQIYIICADRDLSDQDIALFRSIRCKRKIMFTWNVNRADDIEIFAIKSYGRPRIKNYSKLRIDGFRDYEIFFDYVSWIQMKNDFMLEMK